MPQRLFVPYIGSVVVLSEDWTFNLYFESRNAPLIGALYAGPPYDPTGVNPLQAKWGKKSHGTHENEWHDDPRYKVEKAMTDKELSETTRTHRYTRSHDNPYILASLPAGTPLRVDRVYIRKGIDAYSSLTFVVAKECRDKKLRGKRFWAKLRDVNNIVCEAI